MDICGYCSIQITGSVIRFHLRLFSPLLVFGSHLQDNIKICLRICGLEVLWLGYFIYVQVSLSKSYTIGFVNLSARNVVEKQYLRTRVPKELHKEFKQMCVAEEVTMEDVVAELIESWVQEKRKHQKQNKDASND